MKVLGIVFSPRKGGNTEIIMREALEGAKEVGAETELVATREYNIKPCDGCDSCSKTGKCRIDDDMQLMYPKLRNADGIIFGTPVYYWHVCAQAKIFIDRTNALYYPMSLANKVGAAIAVATRTSAFEALSLFLKYFIFNHMICAEIMDGLACEKGEIVNDISGMKAAKELGRLVGSMIKLGNRYPEEYNLPLYRIIEKKYGTRHYPTNP